MIITLGLLSGMLTTCAWLPQLVRTWRRGRADDISYTYLAVFASGVLGWLAYGLLAAQPALLAANVVTFTLIAALTLLKIRPRRPRPATPLTRAGMRRPGKPGGIGPLGARTRAGRMVVWPGDGVGRISPVDRAGEPQQLPDDPGAAQ